MAPKILVNTFSSNSRENYNLRFHSEFNRTLVKSIFNGTETISYLHSRIWDLVSLEGKQKTSSSAFKKVIKILNPHNCPCSLYKKYVAGIGFI